MSVLPSQGRVDGLNRQLASSQLGVGYQTLLPSAAGCGLGTAALPLFTVAKDRNRDHVKQANVWLFSGIRSARPREARRSRAARTACRMRLRFSTASRSRRSWLELRDEAGHTPRTPLDDGR